MAPVSTLSRRSFVRRSASLAAVAASLPVITDAAPPPPAQSGAAIGGFGKSVLTLVQGKVQKLQGDPKYDPFASGEIAVSLRFLFDQMYSVGLTGQVEEHIRSSGMPALDEGFFKPHLDALAQANLSFPAQAQQSFLDLVTTDASLKASIFESAVKQHGLWAWHDGMYAAARLQAARGQVQAIDTLVKAATGTASAGAPLSAAPMSSFRAHAQAIASQLPPQSGLALEPMFTCPSCDAPEPGGYGGGDGNGGGSGVGGPLQPPDDPGSGGGGGGGGGTSAPGQPGDVDTSEDANGTVVYENTIAMTKGEICNVFDATLALGSGLTAGALTLWKNMDPKGAAAAAAAIGFASADILILALGGIGVLAAYYKSFCTYVA